MKCSKNSNGLSLLLWMISCWKLIVPSYQENTSSKITCPLTLFIPFHDSRRDTQWYGTSTSLQDQNNKHNNNNNENEDNSIPVATILNGITLLTTALLAVQDFNQRQSVLIQGLNNDYYYDNDDDHHHHPSLSLLQSCPIQLSISSLWDSSNISAITTDIFDDDDDEQTEASCTPMMVGPHDEASLETLLQSFLRIRNKNNTTATNTRHHNISSPTVFSYGRLSHIQQQQSNYYYNKKNDPSLPSIQLLSSSWEDSIMALSQYLIAKQRHEQSSIAVFESSTEDYYHFPTSLQNKINNHKKKKHQQHGDNDISYVTFPVDSIDYIESLTAALHYCQLWDIKTIIINWEWDDRLQEFATVASSLNMLSSDYMYIFMGDRYLFPNDVILLGTVGKQDDASLEQLLRQSRIFQLVDHLVPRFSRYTSRRQDQYRKRRRQGNQVITPSIIPYSLEMFLPQWTSNNNDNDDDDETSILSQMKQLLRLEQNDDGNSIIPPNIFHDVIMGNEDFFTNHLPSYGSGFIYDSIIAAGITACIEYDKKKVQSHDDDDDYYNYLLEHLTSVFGNFRLIGTNDDNSSKDDDEEEEELQERLRRDPKGLTYGIYILDRQYDFRPFRASLFDYTITTKNGQQEWTTHQDHQDRHLAKWARITGFVLGSFSILICIICAVFVYNHRTVPIVSVAQPAFLYMVCFGSLLLGISILVKSFDDSHVTNIKILDHLCIIETWLLCSGQIIVYMALFCKLWRINQLSQFRRGRKIFVRHVIWPFVVILAATFAVLIAYTMEIPPFFDRQYVGTLSMDDDNDDNANDKNDDTKNQPVTTPICQISSDYAISLRVLVTISVLLVMWMSCKTRAVAEDISDARRIFDVLVAQVAVGAISLLSYVLFMFSGWTNHAYMFRILSNFMYSATSPSLLIGPKMYKVWIEARKSNNTTTTTTNNNNNNNNNRGRAASNEITSPKGIGNGRITITGLDLPPPPMMFSPSPLDGGMEQAMPRNLPCHHYQHISSTIFNNQNYYDNDDDDNDDKRNAAVVIEASNNESVTEEETESVFVGLDVPSLSPPLSPSSQAMTHHNLPKKFTFANKGDDGDYDSLTLPPPESAIVWKGMDDVDNIANTI